MNGLSVPHTLGAVFFTACFAVMFFTSGSHAGNEFQRGDFSGDGSLGIADPIGMLNYLAGGPVAACLDATDVNDDGQVNVVDPVYMLYFLFNGTAPPPPPFQVCGSDPTADSLDCFSYPGCP